MNILTYVGDVVDEFSRKHPRYIELVNLLSDDAETVKF